MIISILVFILSIIPSVLIIKKLRDRKKDDMSYLKGCTETTKKGVISIFPIVGISALFALTLRILQMTVLTGVNTIFIKLIYTFVVLAFVVPFVLHGIYDFSLSEEFLAINDNLAIVGLALAVLDIILLVFMIRFFKHSKNHDKYNVSFI